MIEKTRNYEMFVFRNDNREKIDRSHVNKLKESIRSKNMLDMRPIIVNEKYEIIDGQHRTLAAKELGLEVYYRIERNLGVKEVLHLNLTKSWGVADYLNYFVKNGYQEYIKLDEFCKKNKLHLRNALSLMCGIANGAMKSFRNGEFVFRNELYASELEVCWRIIDYIKRLNGITMSNYTNSTKFWHALIKLVRNPLFDEEKFMVNLSKMVEKCCVKARSEGYCHMLMEINNYRNRNAIDLLEPRDLD